MPNYEREINKFLNSMGFGTQLAPVPGAPIDIKSAIVAHSGLNIEVFVQEPLVGASINFAYLPKQNVAPFFRRLLVLNGGGGSYFRVHDEVNMVSIEICRMVEGLDGVEFKAMLDTIASRYWQTVPGLIQEFQLPQQPG